MTAIDPVGWFNLAVAFGLVLAAPLIERYTGAGTARRSLPARLRSVVDVLAIGVVWAGFFLGLVPDIWILDGPIVTLALSFTVFVALSLALARLGYTREQPTTTC